MNVLLMPGLNCFNQSKSLLKNRFKNALTVTEFTKTTLKNPETFDNQKKNKNQINSNILFHFSNLRKKK